MKDWNEPSTLALVALLVGIALGTLSGYSVAVDTGVDCVVGAP